MNHYRKVTRSRRRRHIIIVVSGLLLLACITLTIASCVFDHKVFFFPMSKQAAQLEDADSLSSLASEEKPQSRQENSSAANAVSSIPPQSAAASIPPSGMSYQSLYPDLYAPVVKPIQPSSEKTVYLTFDDGPSDLTIPLLDVLDQYHVKATFFLMGHTDTADLKAMKEIANRGHSIGVHTYTHRYREIYASPSAYLYDFNRMHELIKQVTGIDTQIYRYAGGSVNSYNRDTARAITQEMNRRGYVYFDWNVSGEDAAPGATAASIYRDTMNGIRRHRQSVVLLHNSSSKRDTLTLTPKIIETLQKEGYQFKTLDASLDSSPYRFPLPKPVAVNTRTVSSSKAVK